MSIPARVADFDFVSGRESETTQPHWELVVVCLSLSVGSMAERFSANFRERFATVRARSEDPF